MNAMIDLMTSTIFLKVCMGLDQYCAELYQCYSRVYEHVPELSLLWTRAAITKANHLKQYELALRLLGETEFFVSKGGLKRAYHTQFELLKYISSIQGYVPELQVSIAKAIEAEEEIEKLHVDIILNFKDESLQKLFRALREADYDYVSELQNVQHELRVAVNAYA